MNNHNSQPQLHTVLGTLLLLAIMLAGCGGVGTGRSAEPASLETYLALANDQVAVTATAAPLAPAAACTGRFIPHALDHTTLTRSQPVRMFETNGAGVAINDLNNDGRLDIVLANLNGPATILWNDGDLQFQREALPDQRTRSVNIVDVDGDGWADIVFTHVSSSLSFWRNLGTTPASFKLTALPGVSKPAHSQAWADLNGDNRLDLVAGSYDAELNLEMTNSFLFSSGAGIFYYEQSDAGFVPQRLATASQALAIALVDFDEDGQRDILVGNDFDTPDMAWRGEPAGWQPATPFAVTAHSTMSLDWATIGNDGELAIFGTDMNPYDTSPD
ncbi:MAG: VCBS repeat-containing protein, partial [Anaerolineales bacterium]|nr:VCBS repeat-containing protein [Anaerolineales bacterium]